MIILVSNYGGTIVLTVTIAFHQATRTCAGQVIILVRNYGGTIVLTVTIAFHQATRTCAGQVIMLVRNYGGIIVSGNYRIPPSHQTVWCSNCVLHMTFVVLRNGNYVIAGCHVSRLLFTESGPNLHHLGKALNNKNPPILQEETTTKFYKSRNNIR